MFLNSSYGTFKVVVPPQVRQHLSSGKQGCLDGKPYIFLEVSFFLPWAVLLGKILKVRQASNEVAELLIRLSNLTSGASPHMHEICSGLLIAIDI